MKAITNPVLWAQEATFKYAKGFLFGTTFDEAG
jgi:hypothetical protein